MFTSSKRRLNLHSFSLQTMQIYTKRGNLFLMIEEKLRKPCNNNSLAHALIIYGLENTG